MKCQPDSLCSCLCPLDAVAYMSRDEEMIAGPQNANILLALKKQAGASGQEYDPLVSVLVVPLTRRR
jgi:hypothetical protein